MAKFSFKIDEKSLYVGLKNDMLKGHTATVATHLKQQNSLKPELKLFLECKNELDVNQYPDLVEECLKKSKSICKIDKFLYFKKIFVNNVEIDCGSYFGLYLKEEINRNAFQFGRIKLHYPINFSYTDGLIEINNKLVFDSIQKHVGDYSFIVNRFDIDDENYSINFDLTIIGENDIPYSKVFKNSKGGSNNFNKVFTEQADAYDYEIVPIKKYVNPEITPAEYQSLLIQFEEKATGIIFDYLKSKGIIYINDVINKYPYSPVDFEYEENGTKKFIILKTTCTGLNSFFLSKHEYGLLSHYPDSAKVCLVKRIYSKNPELTWFDYNDVVNLEKEITSIRVHE